MPPQFTLPSTRSVGTADPPGDMNNAVIAANAMGAGFNVLNAAFAGGADPAGVSDSTAAIQAAINALPASGGTVYLPPGTYKVTSTLTVTSLYAYIKGDGRWATKINFTGTGDCLRIYNTDTTGILTGGGVRDLTIDGTSAGAGSAGLHYGDMRAGELRLAVANFSGAGSTGVHFDNQFAWMEECHGYLWLTNCTQHLVFDVSGASTSTGSFGYSNFDVEILAKQNQDGVVLQNGALYYDSRLSVKGNFQGTSGANTSAVLRITGTVPAGHPNTGTGSKITKSRLDVLAECTSGTGSNAPQSIAFGTLGTNTLLGCTGILDFSMGSLAFAVSNWTATGGTGSFIFTGPIAGDFNLNNSSVGLGASNSISLQGAVSFGKSLLSVVNGNTSVNAGDFFSSTLTGNITISLNPGGASTLGCAQRKTIIIRQASSGGPYTVAWPVSGSPTTSAPTVIWPGGVTPVMSTAASAVDVFNLVTYDGATWYGTAAQASAPPVPLADATAADILPAGVQAAGANGLWADSGHVHPNQGSLALLCAPSGATAETYTRRLATSVSGVLTSGTLYVTAIPLPKGLAVSNLTLFTNTTAKTGGSHGWYVLLDSGRVVRAVTADQTDAATVWGVASTSYTLATNAYTTTAAGVYYLGVCIVATGMPTFTVTSSPATGINPVTPVLGASSSSGQTTPPTAGTTMAALGGAGNMQFYGYTS